MPRCNPVKSLYPLCTNLALLLSLQVGPSLMALLLVIWRTGVDHHSKEKKNIKTYTSRITGYSHS